ncbi:hypothetical protein [Bacillus cereus group sp. BfR-BA-01399]|uniref:hypothetical protein n=1 Tax=Bacillus cereus group sp. BfR-BA-01399 TaxID=2920333 RepID=UPI000ACB6752
MRELKRNFHGKLYFSSKIHNWKSDFNIAHSGEWVVLAIPKYRNICIDVEEVKPFCFNKLKELARFIFP